MDMSRVPRGRWWRLSAAPVIAGAALVIAGLGPASAHAEPAAAGAQAAGPASAQRPEVALKAALTAVSCKTSSFCLAVGWSQAGSHARRPLTEVWHGTRWRVIPDPVRRLFTSVSCASPTFCMARTKAGFAAWNGTRWTALASQPQPGLQGTVTCGSPTSCMTITGGNRIKRWTGRHWQLMGGPSNICNYGAPGTCEWDSLSCGGVRNCLATGFLTIDQCCGDTEPWTASWNGRDWQGADSPPLDGNLSCTPMRFCMEVSASSTMPSQAATWIRGKGWQDVSPDLSAVCSGIAHCLWPDQPFCGSPETCALFLPGSVPVIWDGSSWAAEPFAPVTSATLRVQAVSCGSTGTCMAVGDEMTPGGREVPAAQRWDGSAWKTTSGPPA
jgi:hypothetical protein